MKKLMLFYFICVMMTFAETFPNQKFINFSTDRSTWFFRADGNENNKVFSDFFAPFDPTVKLDYFDPLVMYELESNYYFNKDNIMINIEDLKKLYAPYFDYKIENNNLIIGFLNYDRTIISGYGQRATELKYHKKAWTLKIDLTKKNGTYDYTEYVPVIGTDNSTFIETDDLKVDKTEKNIAFSLKDDEIQQKNKSYYVSLKSIMKLLGMDIIEEGGYTAVQFKNMADVTAAVERDVPVKAVRLPRASNPWRSGKAEKFNPDYTWADYMNDTADGKRNYGWQWKSFYIPSGDHFRDADGNQITLSADRISPVALYIPKNYSAENSRLTYVLHGGTGNENAPMYRTMDRDNNLDEFAEKYNYILVSPNGWTKGPLWMHEHAHYAFEKSLELIMEKYPVSRDKIFMMGNSAGARGAFDLTSRYPEMFKAMVATAPAWAVGQHTQIKQSRYSLKDMENVPSLIGLGTADITFPYKLEVGNKKEPGWMTKDVVPVLNNARYVAIEEGNHAQNWGSILNVIFEFFEENIQHEKLNADPSSLKISEKDLKIVGNTPMISLDTLEKITENRLKVFSVYSYDKSPKDAVNYFTLTYGNNSVNVRTDSPVYRKNIERYKEDAGAKDKDEEYLDHAPKFSVTPFVENGKVYVPAQEVLSLLEIK